MYYRITKVVHQEGKRDEIISIIEKRDEEIKSITGLQSLQILGANETESYSISVYENEQQILDSESKFREIMSEMIPLFTGPPEIVMGEIVWSKMFN
ncbi:MAG: hypothetical protein HRU40_20750 [Saprospiraceae bacterium]|nr:hypothetical protein [Saprospiraceae bacterium]